MVLPPWVRVAARVECAYWQKHAEWQVGHQPMNMENALTLTILFFK
jgi:hypothetical protein